MMKQTERIQGVEDVEPEGVNGLWGYPGRLSAGEERDWLMSLALDGELTPQAEARLNALLAADSGADEQWQMWRALDGALAAADHVAPPADFAARLDEQLVLKERRRHLRTGALFALAAVGLWGSMVAGLIAITALVWNNQAVWAADALRNRTYWLAAFGHLAETLVAGVRTLLAAPQTQLMLACYAVGSAAVLLVWVMLLRRSLQSAPLENR
jgi:hypothetical protein